MTAEIQLERTAQKPKRALVLPGGGARGAFQVGVARALHEMSIHYDLVVGTSIGALNATLIAQQRIDRLEELWCTIRPRDIFRLPNATQIGRMVLGQKLGLLDNSPLEQIIRREADLDCLKQSQIKVGLFTTDICSLETRLVTSDTISTNEELVDLLMATSALPIAFPPRPINGEGLWIDGGLVRNTPVQAAVDMGADEIFVVLLHPSTHCSRPANILHLITRCLDVVLDASASKEIDSLHMYNRLIDEGVEAAAGKRKIKITVLQPKHSVNSTLLEVDPSRARNLIKQGYEIAREVLVHHIRCEAA